MAAPQGGLGRPVSPDPEPEDRFRRLQRVDPSAQEVHRQRRQRHARHAGSPMSGRTCQRTSRIGKKLQKFL